MKYALPLLLMLWSAATQAANLPEKDVLALQGRWADLQYGTADKDAQERGFAALAKQAEALVGEHPGAPEPLLWKGIALASQAQQHDDTSGIRLAEQGRDALQQSITIDPAALKGAAYITLGALYYKVPGWPLGFGNDTKAKEYLQKAVQLNPDSVDANYFYGDFLFQKKRYPEAAERLRKAIAAPKQPGAPIADAGRRKDAQEILAKAERKLATSR